MTNAVHTETNETTNMQANVFARRDGGFNVMVKDLDSGNTLPEGWTRISSLGEAIELARQAVL